MASCKLPKSCPVPRASEHENQKMYHFVPKNSQVPQMTFDADSLDINNIFEAMEEAGFEFYEDIFPSIGYGVPKTFYGLQTGCFNPYDLGKECPKESVQLAKRFISDNFDVFEYLPKGQIGPRLVAPNIKGKQVDRLWDNDETSSVSLSHACVDVLHEFYLHGQWNIALRDTQGNIEHDVSCWPKPQIICEHPHWFNDKDELVPILWFGPKNGIPSDLWSASEESLLWSFNHNDSQEIDDGDAWYRYYTLCIENIEKACSFSFWTVECAIDIYYSDFLEVWAKSPIDLFLPLCERKEQIRDLAYKCQSM